MTQPQTPTIAGNWLWKDEDNDRLFKKEVYLGINAAPWSECTNAEKEAWEAEHNPPEPEENE